MEQPIVNKEILNEFVEFYNHIAITSKEFINRDAVILAFLEELKKPKPMTLEKAIEITEVDLKFLVGYTLKRIHANVDLLEALEVLINHAKKSLEVK